MHKSWWLGVALVTAGFGHAETGGGLSADGSAPSSPVEGYLDSDSILDSARIVEGVDQNGCRRLSLVVETSRERRTHSGRNVFFDGCISTNGASVQIQSRRIVVLNSDEPLGVASKASYEIELATGELVLVSVQKNVVGPDSDPPGQHRFVVWDVASGRITTVDADSGRKSVQKVKIVRRTLEETDALRDFNPDIMADEL